MIHYHVWFNLRPAVPEADGLATVARFLRRLCEDDEAATFQLLRNQGGPPRSKLPRYHALLVFSDADQLAAATKQQADRGIHAGLAVIDAVVDFHVELFTLLEAGGADAPAGNHACEI